MALNVNDQHLQYHLQRIFYSKAFEKEHIPEGKTVTGFKLDIS